MGWHSLEWQLPRADNATDAKKKAEMAAMAKGSKGPLNTGSQGIKKSGKK